MTVSPTLCLTHSGQNHAYELRGGILLVSYPERNENDDEQGGHTVALVRDRHDWVLVDDETVLELSEDTAMDLFSGSESSLVEKGTHIQGMLLIYQSTQFPNDAVENLLRTMYSEKQVAAVDWSQPHDLIGRRLSIQWSQGKQYTGRVVSYNETTRKHTVEYDDGDIRTYNMQKKTIEWL